MYKLLILLALSATLFVGCGEKREEKKQLGSGMKCGAGKCGASMIDGNSALDKKKTNVLAQMREKDSRKDCVMNAKTTKAVYNCVRDPNGRMLTIKCGTGKCGEAKAESTMKCGAGKCGASMQEAKPTPKAEPAMKCGAGKCGSSM